MGLVLLKTKMPGPHLGPSASGSLARAQVSVTWGSPAGGSEGHPGTRTARSIACSRLSPVLSLPSCLSPDEGVLPSL